MLDTRYLRRSAVVVSAILVAILALSLIPRQEEDSPEIALGRGSLENLREAYEKWVDGEGSSSPLGPSISLVWNKGLSSRFSQAKGKADLDLVEGKVRVWVKGLESERITEVWLVDNVPGPDRSTRPEPGDKFIHVGSLRPEEGYSWLQEGIAPEPLKDFEVNWVVVAEKGTQPGEGGILYGSTSLFQRIFYYPETTPAPWREAEPGKSFVNLLPASVHAQGITPPGFPNAALINEGRDLFFNETFNGNGRTCGTCHPEESNFTIEPTFIATLDDDDPLFLAERPDPNPLKENFEKPELMRKVGLILENTNGFGDLENNFTMRGVPHILGLRTSLSAPTGGNDGTTIPPDERTGWSGDGSPVDLSVFPQLRGSLRDFAVGAVIQHFPVTLNRQDGVDFRLPTQFELDALEAFQLSVGRQTEFDDLTEIELTNEIADRGRENFLGEGIIPGTIPCNACHFNGGANTDPTFDFPAAVTPPAFEETNRSFAPRVEELLDQAGDIIDEANNPFDDGFGSGTNLFNVPTVIEAADTGPFFHANQIETVEGLISFYTSQRHLRDGTVLPAIVGLNGAQVSNVGAFMRVVNADENARAAIVLIDKALQLSGVAPKKVNLRLALADVEDAIEVLECGKLHFDDAVPMFEEAGDLLQNALDASSNGRVRFWARRARNELIAVRDTMIDRD